MRSVLGIKQRSNHVDFLRVYEHIDEYVSPDELAEATAQAVTRIDSFMIRNEWQNVAYAWSGGKDSIALGHVCEAASISECCFGMTSGLEYPEFLQWVTTHMPPPLEVMMQPLDMDWLVGHQDLLFPRKANVATRWFQRIQHRAQRDYYNARSLDAILLGRRWSDSNYTGRTRGDLQYTAKGITRFSPIADWSHEMCLAVMAYHGPPPPPCYSWPRGYQVGTGCWPARQWTRDDEHAWSEVHTIDPSVVHMAAKYDIRGSRDFLQQRGEL